MFNIFDLIDFNNNNRNRAVTLSVIGSGGKTTLIRTIAEQIKKEAINKEIIKTVITTTTHMAYPFEKFINFADIDDNNIKDFLRESMDKYGIILSGDDGYGHRGIIEESRLKLKAPSNDIISLFIENADFVIAEADGSKRLPMKATNSMEPQLLPDTDFVILVFGISALGQPLNKVCHRFEIAQELLNIKDDIIVDENIAADLIKKSYFPKLDKNKLCMVVNQADTELLRARAESLIALLDIKKSFVIGNNPLRIE